MTDHIKSQFPELIQCPSCESFWTRWDMLKDDAHYHAYHCEDCGLDFQETRSPLTGARTSA